MKNLKNKVTLLNSLTTLILQIVTIISGFIIPKIILSYFGSEVNGLVSSLNQFLNYIALVEGGVTGVIVANLFKPLVDDDKEKLSSIVVTSKGFYRKIGYIFIIYSVLLSFIYPLIVKNEFSYQYILILSLILSIKLFVQYVLSLTYKCLLQADKKLYIVSITNTFMIIFNIILCYLSVKIYPSIHILKLIEGLLFILQPIIYGLYVKKHYTFIDGAPEDKKLLKNRWSGLAVNIAAFIHNNTDITILSLLTDFKTVSIYSVYYLVTAGLRQIVTFFSSGISPTMGHALANGDESIINEKLDLYENVIFVINFLLFTVGGLLITPFVMLYTKNITDANYYQPLFGVLIILSEAFYMIKTHHLNLAYNSNKFKEITIPCYIEAMINIIISLILVPKYGLVGVAIGTLIAMIYRMAYHVWFTNKEIVKRPIKIFYSKLLSFSLFTIIGLLICYYVIPKVELTIISWVIHAIIYTLLFSCLYLINSVLLYKNELKKLFKYFGIGKD